MQLGGRDRESFGSSTDLAQADQVRPPVERGVLDALGHHSTSDLLEPDDHLGAPRVRPPSDCHLPAEEQVGDRLQRVVPSGRQHVPSALRGGGHDVLAGPTQRLARDDVGPVPIEFHE